MNSLALHQYTVIVVNMTGYGLDNVCALKIQPPSDDDYAQSWDNWRHTSYLYHYSVKTWKTTGLTVCNT